MRLFPRQSARCVLPAALVVWLVLPAVPQGPHTESGLASWYGFPYHGRSAASGEVYDMEGLTAAHPTLPFNTLVRVVNLANDKSIQVRITDRGPFMDGRIIDLSRAAARSIGLMDTGTAQVRVEVIGMGTMDARPPAPAPVAARPAVAARAVVVPVALTAAAPAPVALRPAVTARAVVASAVLTAAAAAPVVPAPSSPGSFAVQMAAFRDPGNAARYFGLMKARFSSAQLVPPQENSGIWRVVVGSETTHEGAEALSARIRRDSGENNAFVVRLDSHNEPDRSGQSTGPRGTVAADGLHSPSDR